MWKLKSFSLLPTPTPYLLLISMRAERVASLLEKEISYIVSQELKDPRLGFVTITKVFLTADLKEATVYFSTLGDKVQDLNTLQQAKGYIKTMLARRIRLRFIPNLQFRFDNSYEYGQRIDDLFKKISKDNKE